MNPSDLRMAALAFVALSAAALSACGGDAAALAPKQPGEEVTSTDGAIAALDQAEAELGRVLGDHAGAGYAAAPAASAAPVAPAPPPPPPRPGVVAEEKPRTQSGSKAAAPRDGRLGEREGPAGQGDMCSTACSALASMERAAEHLCGLAGAGDARCESARTRVKDAGLRVHAACPACAR